MMWFSSRLPSEDFKAKTQKNTTNCYLITLLSSLKKTMNYNIYRISRDKWNKIVNNHSRQHHNPTSGNQIYIGKKGKESF